MNEVMVECIDNECRKVFEHRFEDDEAMVTMDANCPACGKTTYVEVEKKYEVSFTSNVA